MCVCGGEGVNQEGTADESWGVLPLMLTLSTALLSDCREASARQLSKPNPFPPLVLSLLMAVLDRHLHIEAALLP